jgi:hypothetical protein
MLNPMYSKDMYKISLERVFTGLATLQFTLMGFSF